MHCPYRNVFKRCFLPWFLFAVNSLSLPTIGIIVRVSNKQDTMINTVESTLVPTFIG